MYRQRNDEINTEKHLPHVKYVKTRNTCNFHLSELTSICVTHVGPNWHFSQES